MSDVVNARGDSPTNFAHHSQGNLLANSGLDALGSSVAGNDGGYVTYGSYGSPVNAETLNAILDLNGIHLGVSSTNDGDFVGEQLGNNQGVFVSDQVGDQVTIVTHQDGNSGEFQFDQVPVIDLPNITKPETPLFSQEFNHNLGALFGFGADSPHSNYNCLSNCGAYPEGEE